MPRAYDGPRWRDVEAEVRRRHAEGDLDRDAIAAVVGVNPATLRKWCSQAGLRFDARGRRAPAVRVIPYSMAAASRLLRDEVMAAKAEMAAYRERG